jgi:hypothetical protein
VAQQSGNLIGPKQLGQGSEDLINQVKLNEQRDIGIIKAKAQAESDQKDAEVQKAYDEMLQSETELEKSITDEDKKQSQEKAKQLTLQQEINRGKIQAQLEGVRSNPLLTDDEKLKQSIPLEQQLIELNAQRIAQLQELASAPGTTADAQLEAQKQIIQLQTQQMQLQNEMTSQENPWLTMFTGLASHADITMHSLAATFSSIFNSAVNSISNGITGLIMGTMTWGQALRSVASTVLNTVIQSIVQMGVQWVLTRLMMFFVGKTLQAAELLAAAGVAKTLIGINTSPAALASIASYGGAVAAAAPVYAIASAGLFSGKDGGYTGGGDVDEVAGIVHGQEFVFSAPAVKHYGLGNLEAMHDAARSGGGGSSSPGGVRSGGSGVSIYPFIDHHQMAEHLQRNDDHEKWVVDVMSKNMHRFR